MSQGGTVRREVYYSGRVQGVGFRFTVRSLAADYAVTGYVRNLPDGRVELVVEGPPDEVAGLLDEVRRTFSRYIRDAQETDVSPSGRFTGFEIRR